MGVVNEPNGQDFTVRFSHKNSDKDTKDGRVESDSPAFIDVRKGLKLTLKLA